jgi:hypothetical protein
MPSIPQSPLQDGSAVTDADLAALLAGDQDVAPWLQPVADVLAALSTEPSPGELAGEAHALAAYRRQTGGPATHRRARRGTAGLTPRLSTKVAAGAAAAVVVMGGAATAAFAGVLPAPIQRLAHDALGAPNAPSAPQHRPARDITVAPAPPGSRGKLTASAKPHSPARHQNRHDQGQQPASQSQQGNGPGSSHGQGQSGDGQGQQGGGQGQGQQGVGQGQQGNGQGNPHARGQQGNPHPQGQQGNPHPHAKSVPYRARHARPARHAPTMDP